MSFAPAAVHQVDSITAVADYRITVTDGDEVILSATCYQVSHADALRESVSVHKRASGLSDGQEPLIVSISLL